MAENVPDLISTCTQNEGYQIFFTHIPTDKVVSFTAFLDSWEDKWEQKWNSAEVYGRMDPIATYQRTGRSISFSFKILNFDLETGFENMDKFSQLVNFQYPEYFADDATSIKTAPLIKLKFSNWTYNEGFKGLLGYLSGISYSPSMDAGTLIYDGDRTKMFHHMPKELVVNCDFTVLHTHRLGWNGQSTRGPASYPHNYKTSASSQRDRKQNKTKRSTAKTKDKVIDSFLNAITGGRSR